MLVQAGKQGLPVARLQSAFGMPASSFSHHLKRLVEAGLLRQVRSGTKLICHAEAAPMDELIAYLSAECVQRDEGTK